MTLEQRAWIFLNHVPMLGPLRLRRLLEKWPRADEILRLSAGALNEAGISQELALHWARSFRNPDLARRVDDEMARSERGEFKIVTEADAEYPEALKNFLDRPPVLYLRGRWPMNGPALAVVGTRLASAYGLDIAAQWSGELAARGIVIISGLAAGIDAAAHRAALGVGGWTVAVLGHGFRFAYPRSNERLYKEIAERGTLVSEFPFGCPPDPGQFPRRNRIVSGLSRAVLVVEAPLQSGALITARCAAEQGREVLATPGPLTGSRSAGCHRLIQDGARLVASSAEVLEALGMQRHQEKTPMALAPQNEDVELWPALEKKVWMNLENSPVTVDELATLLQAPVDQLANALLSLELRGLVHHLPGQHYARKSG